MSRFTVHSVYEGERLKGHTRVEAGSQRPRRRSAHGFSRETAYGVTEKGKLTMPERGDKITPWIL
jgi:hypothetical protein